MTYKVQKHKTAIPSVLPAVEAFKVRKNKKMSVLGAWSAILKELERDIGRLFL